MYIQLKLAGIRIGPDFTCYVCVCVSNIACRRCLCKAADILYIFMVLSLCSVMTLPSSVLKHYRNDTQIVYYTDRIM